jgi:hypothetical protein
MVKPTDTRDSDDLPELLRLNRAGDRRVAVEAHMRAIFVVVVGVLTDQVEEVTLTEHDHVIEQFSTKGAQIIPKFPVVDGSGPSCGRRGPAG